MKKIYTCTPISFEANEHFHIRDTGLISATLRTLGVESKCIMPLPHHKGDLDLPLIRTEMENLRDSKWWKNLGIDCVVLYSWGAPKYTKIARAIKKAGLELMIHMDFSGNLNISRKSRSPVYWVKNLIFNFFRSIHLRYADYLSVSPYAKSRFIKNFLYGKSFEKKIHIWPTPVAPHFKIVPGIERQRKVVCVGRWTDNAADAIKRPGYCMGVAAALVSKDTEVIVEIYGRIGEGMLKMHESIPSDQRNRILLKGYAHNSDLPRIYSGAQVTICTSYSEGTHIASAEAVCCGCSVVVPPTERHRVIQWYTSHDSGRIPDEDTPESMANAVLDELQCWQNQNRNPEEISSYWQEVFHTDKAMKRIFNL